MSLDAETLSSLLSAHIPGLAHVSVDDVRGDGSYWRLSIAAARFNGLNKLEQHRIVYAALGGLVEGIDAIELHTRPDTALLAMTA